MKRMKRLILGIIRRPMKSIILMLAVFIMANVISASFMLFNSSNQVVNTIQDEVAPSVYFYSPISYSNAETIEEIRAEEAKWPNYNIEKNSEMTENHIMALQEMSQLKEVKYIDFGIDAVLYKDDFVEFNRHSWGKNELADGSEVVYPNQCIDITGVFRNDFYDLKENNAVIVYGRNFADEEIETGAYVILVPYRSHYENGQNINVGDKVTLSLKIFSQHIDSKEYKTKDDYYQANNDSILEKKKITFEVIGIYDDPNRNERFDKGLREAYGSSTFFLPINTLEEIISMNNKILERNRDKLKDSSYTNQIYRKDRYNYFELNSNSDIESFTKKAKEILNKYGLEYHEINVSNDLYLKLAGPLAGIHSVSKTILIAGCSLFFIIMICISLLFTKDRKKEIGLLLAFGESQKNIIKQMLGEIILIGLLGIVLSYATTPLLAKAMSNNLIDNAPIETLNNSETNLLDETKVNPEVLVLEYQRGLKGEDIIIYSPVCLEILVVSASCSILMIIKQKPKDILM